MKSLNILLLIVLILLTSCSNSKKIKLVERNFSEEVKPQSVLNFTFSQNMVPDSIVGVWSDLQYIRFEPETEGKFLWQTASILVFTPKAGFQPATSYTCKFTGEVFRYVNKATFSGDKEFSFRTPLLEVLNYRAFWEINKESGDPCIRLEMEFNYPVSPGDITRLLSLKVGDREVTPVPASEELSDKVSWMVRDIPKEDKDYPIEIKLDKGLTPQGGTEKTTEIYVEKFDIPSPFKLEISDVQSNHDGTEGTITIYTTQEAVEENIKNFISLSPTVRYEVEVEPGYILIKSQNFSIDEHYEVTVKEGLTGKIGGKLKYEFSQPVSFAEVQPTIRFYDEKEFYLSGKGSRNIQVAILNIPKVNITVTKLYENNIIKYISGGGYGEYYYDYEYDDYYYYNSADVGSLGDVVYTKEVETSVLPRKGSNRVLTLDFEDKLSENQGVYVIEVTSEDHYWLRATKMLAISDIGLIVKEGKNNITVFANSLKTAQPLANVTVKFIGRNNQESFRAKTDADGLAVYEFAGLKAPGFATALITAQLGQDYNIIPLEKTRINTSRYDVGGKYQNPSGIEAFIYGDRDLYRPGEKINISAIIRNQAWNIPGEIPVLFKFVSPNGKEFKTIRKNLNKFGSFETQIELPVSSQTGSYIANLYSGNEILIGSKVIKVEEFMPDRIKVEVTVDRNDYKPGEEVVIGIEATNFFGPPAANRNYEVEMSTQRIGFYPKKNNEYNYAIEGTTSYFDNILRNSTTDSEGKAKEIFSIPPEYKNMGALKSDVFITVFDETGRPVNRLKEFKIYTQNIFYGVKCEDYYVRTSQPVNVGLVAVDKEGTDLKGIEAEIKLIRWEYKTVLSRSGDYFRYRSERIENVLQEKTIRINETSTQFSFIPDLSGQYEIRLTAPGVGTYVKHELYAYGWGSTSYSSFKVNNEGQIEIEPDKEKYAVGEKANLIIKAPFSGKMLITLETDKVVDHFYIETDKRAASFSLDLKEEYLPNIYISATLFKPHEESDIPLTVAHGYASLKIDNPAYKMPLTIEAVEKSRSNTTQTIRVKARPNSALTIAVVDEGILQVSGMATPDPYAFYYQRRALEVNTSNVYPYLFPEIGMVRSHTGGDAGEMAKRLNPMQNNRVKLVSYWSGILETNSRGEAEYTINIPQFSGDLRIMAVGYSGKVFGSAQKNIKVADPLVMSVALPRFLSPGDVVDVPVTLTNTTGKETSCKAVIRVEGPLKVNGESGKTVTIAANQESQLPFAISAAQDIGESKVIVEAQALGETFRNITDITVRPASPLQKRTGAGVIKGGREAKIAVEVQDFVPSSLDGKLIISKNPMVQFVHSLDYLVQYPYGCVEQTVSAAFPQLYFGELVGAVYSKEKAKNDALRNVQYALDRIKLMQLYNGGLTYWPGSGSETWWGSAYAAHFAVEAKKAGYEVDENFLNQLLKYLKGQLQKKELITYYYNIVQKKQIAPREAIYSLYILTLAGEKPTSLLNYYSTRTDQLSLDSRYMLASAYGLSGDMEKARKMMPAAFEGEKSVPSFGGSFNSPIRDEALALNVLLEIDPDNQQIGIMAQHISEGMKNSRYLNTQERSFGLLAMGKIAKRTAQSTVKAQVMTGGKKVATFENADISLSLKNFDNKDIVIKTEGSGDLFYFWQTEGISADGSFIEEDSYLSVRRTLYDRNGSVITNKALKQNDLVLVRISITGLTNRQVENVAISDILPACFEIENPRLTDLPPGMHFPTQRNTPEYLDIRDDRINMFTSVGNYPMNFYYLVRVVSKGTYVMGPVGADAMYNGEYHSYSGAGIIMVE